MRYKDVKNLKPGTLISVQQRWRGLLFKGTSFCYIYIRKDVEKSDRLWFISPNGNKGSFSSKEVVVFFDEVRL